MARPSMRVDAVLIQAVIAGALSFAHLHDLAAAAGQDGWKAWAYPISVDLLLVAAWRRLRKDGPSRLAWSWFLIALVASLGANVATPDFSISRTLRPGCASASLDGPRLPSSAGRSSPTRRPRSRSARPFRRCLRLIPRRRSSSPRNKPRSWDQRRFLPLRSLRSCLPPTRLRPCRPRLSITPGRSPTTTAPVPVHRSIPTRSAPASEFRLNSPPRLPLSSPDPRGDPPCPPATTSTP